MVVGGSNNVESVGPFRKPSMQSSVNDLKGRFGDSVSAAYVKGKTMFRNRILQKHPKISMLEAELIVDTLEANHLITFTKRGTSPPKPLWKILA